MRVLARLLFCPTPTNRERSADPFYDPVKKKLCAPLPPSLDRGTVYKYIQLIRFCLQNVCFKLGVKLLVGTVTGQH